MKKKKPAAQGIGYTAGVGKVWDVNAYLKNKEAKNQQIIKIIEVIQILADSCADLDSSEEMADSKKLLS